MLDVKSQDISIPDTVVVLCTAPDEATAQDLAAKVLAEGVGTGAAAIGVFVAAVPARRGAHVVARARTCRPRLGRSIARG